VKIIKLTTTQYNLMKSLLIDGSEQTLSRLENDDYDNNTKVCEEIYGKNYRVVRKNLFKKLNIKGYC
jgi:DNA-binding XRE family transcriptional regulator